MSNKPKAIYLDKRPNYYVDFDSAVDLQCLEGRISDILSERFDVCFTYDLLNYRTDEITGGNYFALITHFPYDKDYSYDTSMNILRKIREKCPKLHIIIYTGGDKNMDDQTLMEEIGVVGIVRKGRRFEDDARQIRIVMRGIPS